MSHLSFADVVDGSFLSLVQEVRFSSLIGSVALGKAFILSLVLSVERVRQ